MKKCVALSNVCLTHAQSKPESLLQRPFSQACWHKLRNCSFPLIRTQSRLFSTNFIGNYGEKGFEQMQFYIERAANLCVAYTEKIDSLAPAQRFDELLASLYKLKPRPRVSRNVS